jgi:quercetin dioxygenase-like cupin family protein
MRALVSNRVDRLPAPINAASCSRSSALSRTTPDHETLLAKAEIEPGFLVPRYIHPGIESAYIVEGGGVFSIDGGDDREVRAGDTLQVPERRPPFAEKRR